MTTKRWRESVERLARLSLVAHAHRLGALPRLGVFASRWKALGLQEAARETPAARRGWKPEMQISRYSRASKASLRPCLPISLFAPLSRLLLLLSPSAVFARLHRFVFPPFPFPSARSSSNIFFPILAPMFLSLEFGFAQRLDSLYTPFTAYPVYGGSLVAVSLYLTEAHIGLEETRRRSAGEKLENERSSEEGEHDDDDDDHHHHDDSLRWLERRRKEVASLLARASDRWRWPLSSPPPLGLVVIHHLGLFFTYFICNIFRNFYSVNRPPPPRAVTPGQGQLIKQRAASWTIHRRLAEQG